MKVESKCRLLWDEGTQCVLQQKWKTASKEISHLVHSFQKFLLKWTVFWIQSQAHGHYSYHVYTNIFSVLKRGIKDLTFFTQTLPVLAQWKVFFVSFLICFLCCFEFLDTRWPHYWRNKWRRTRRNYTITKTVTCRSQYSRRTFFWATLS